MSNELFYKCFPMNKTAIIGARFTPAEKLQLLAAARKERTTISKWLRAVAMKAACNGKEKR